MPNPLRNQNLTTNRIVQAAVRKIYPLGKVRTIHRGPLRGLQFTVAPSMGFTYAWGIGIEQWDFAYFVRPGMCVYDIGANCGQSTLSLARLVGSSGRVVAFEPVEDIFSVLTSNIRLNPSLQITPICAAACEQNGRFDFLFDRKQTTKGHLSDVEPSYALPQAKAISVRGVRLDDVISEGCPKPQFLKIDVEGGAGAVLRGARTLIAQCRPNIFVELHGPEEQESIRELLATSNYAAQTLSGLDVPNPTEGWFSPLICKPK